MDYKEYICDEHVIGDEIAALIERLPSRFEKAKLSIKACKKFDEI